MPTEEEVIVDISPRTPSTESSVEKPHLNNHNDADIYTAAVQLVYNPSVESSTQLGLFLQLSTLKYSYKTTNLHGVNFRHERRVMVH